MKISFCILLLFFVCSCETSQRKPETKFAKLQVAIKSSYLRYLDYPQVKFKGNGRIVDDSITNQTISVYDSLRKGKWSVSIFSLLTEDFIKKIDLDKDSVLTFDSSLYAGFKYGDPKDLAKLLDSNIDTLYIGRWMSGCFAGYKEKIFICKTGTKYIFSYERSDNVIPAYTSVLSDTSFRQYLKNLINRYYKLYPTSRDEVVISNSSTDHIETFIRNGNTIYNLPEFIIDKGYDNFKSAVGEKALKESK